MRFVSVIFLLSLMHNAYAQKPVNHNWWVGSDQRSFIMLNAGINATSADFSNRFVEELVLSDQLTQETIGNEIKALNSSKNSVGLDYEMAVQGAWNVKYSSHSLLFKIADVAHLDANIPKNITKLVFKGNKSYAGDTLDFSGLSAMGMRYQQMAIGWQYQPTPSSAVFALVSYINGEQYVEGDFERSWLYTSVLGDTLSTSLNGGFSLSDTGRSGFAVNNGSGAAIDLGFHMQFEAEESTWDFDFAINNLGMIQWSKKTLNVNLDSNYTWRGIEIEDITNVNGQFAENELADSLSGGVIENINKQKKNVWLPGAIHAELLQRRDAGFETGGGWVMRWNANFNPFVYLKNGYRFNDHIATHLSFGYGGYGTVQAGLSGSFEWSHFAANLELRNMEALILPGRFAGGSGVVNVRYLF